jgi:hypothetical protein
MVPMAEAVGRGRGSRGWRCPPHLRPTGGGVVEGLHAA